MQSTSTGGINLKTVNNHLIKLVDIPHSYKINFSSEFSVAFEKTQEMTEKLDIEINLPRKAAQQFQRPDHPFETTEDFFRR